MSKFRTSGPDVFKPLPEKPEEKPGELPAHRIPIYDHKGNRRGHVGYKASGATVARFIGPHGATLGKKDGRTAWLGKEPPPKPKPKVNPAAANPAAGAPAANAQNAKLEISLKTAKGSVTDKPSAPKTSARPKRG